MRLLKEPLLHFLLIGALLFAIDALRAGDAIDPARRIEIGAAEQQRLVALWQRKWLRPPNAAELKGLIDSEVREQILYREALAMGLDRDDTIVRRRLAQKLEFLFEDVAATETPDEAELQQYFAGHQADYLEPERLSLVQVYFSVDRRGAVAASDAAQALLNLQAAGGSPASAGEALGDPSLLPHMIEAQSPDEIARQFGTEFSDQLRGLPIGSWQGPIESTFGYHLVRIEERSVGGTPEFIAVRDAVLRDYQREQRELANAAFYESLRDRYQVIIAPITAATLTVSGQ